MAPACCEKSPCAALCRGLACFASRDVTANRRAVVKTLVGIHVCCVVVAAVACLGALETKALKSTAWASVTMDTVGGPNGALYVGFRGVWVDGPGARNGSAPSPIDGYYAWDDFEDLVPSDESGGVEDCAAASTGLFSTSVVGARAAKESEIPNFKGSYLGRFPLVSADFWTSDHLSEQSRSVDAFSGTRARETLSLKRR